jgi:hypothetical protein
MGQNMDIRTAPIDQFTIHPDLAIAIIISTSHRLILSAVMSFLHLLRKLRPHRTYYCVKTVIRYRFGLGMSTTLTYADPNTTRV